MATFTDKKNREWKVELDAPLVEEIQQKHGIALTNLETDPLLTLRNDPLVLVAVIHVLCQSQIDERDLTPEDFAKSLPHPPDDMMEAVKEAIVSFFHSGRHSHVREVLAKYEEMTKKTDELAIAKMEKVLNDPNTTKRLNKRADKEFDRAMEEMFPLEVGT